MIGVIFSYARKLTHIFSSCPVSWKLHNEMLNQLASLKTLAKIMFVQGTPDNVNLTFRQISEFFNWMVHHQLLHGWYFSLWLNLTWLPLSSYCWHLRWKYYGGKVKIWTSHLILKCYDLNFSMKYLCTNHALLEASVHILNAAAATCRQQYKILTKRGEKMYSSFFALLSLNYWYLIFLFINPF